MMKHRLPYFLILFTFLFAAPVLGGDEPLSCADKSVTASAVRTQEDIQAFVQCAYEFVQEMGFEEARRAFHEEARWRSGQIYVFVAEATPMSDMSRVFVFPPDPSREGEPWGLLIDIFGNDWFREQHRIVNQVGEGWIYYSFTNPATGRDEPKASYLKSIDWDGALATIGAAVEPGADRSRVSFPVDALDVGSFRLILARRWICERVVEPTLSEVADQPVRLFVVVVSPDVDQCAPGLPLPCRVGREDERSSDVGVGDYFVDEDIDRAVSPTRVFVEGPPGRRKAHFLDELVGALNEGLNILLCAHGTGNDGLIRTRQGCIGAESRRGQEGEGNQEMKCSILPHGERLTKNGSEGQ